MISKEWVDILSPFILSKEYTNIQLAISKERERYSVWPTDDRIFRAFEVCPYEELKCIIVGQDPYFTKGVADGVAMSCSLTGKLQPSLKMFYDEINRTVYDNKITQYDPCLDYLAKQGVLLVNRALTVRENVPRSHLSIWETFAEYLFSTINKEVAIIMLGKEGQYIQRYLPPFKHFIIDVEHPAAASYQRRAWNCKNCFISVNRYLKLSERATIKWLNEDYGAQTTKGE